MKKRIIKLTESDIEKLVKKIIKEDENIEFDTEKAGTSGEKKVEKITDKAVFDQFKRFLENKPATQQVDLVLSLLNSLPLEQDFYTRFKRRIVSMK
jgi:acyl CoA:acetate/3-ketoacid CoA transferase